MTRVAVLSVNSGNYDRPTEWPDLVAPNGVSIEVFRYDDETLHQRSLAMTSRLLCGIPKWWGWQMLPGFTHYMWVDASCVPEPNAVEWFLRQLGEHEIAVFQHPDRRTIREEFEFMVERMARRGETYLNSRYRDEYLHEQYAYIANDDAYTDDKLYASTAFIYRPTERVTQAFKAVWGQKARFLLHDQLAFPYELDKAGCDVAVIDRSYLRCTALRYVRNQKGALVTA